jgi:plastocyanin
MRVSLRRAAALLAAASFAAGCGGGGGGGGNNNSTLSVAKAGAQSGDAQTATVGTTLQAMLQVVVMDNGAVAAGQTVTWSVAAGGGAVNPTSSVTDANGVAATAWTLGTAAGGQTARAALSGASGSPVNFTATGTAGPPAAFTKAGGDGQSAVVNLAFTQAVSAKVADQFGNGVAGITVNWAVQSGPVSLNGPSSTTNAQGVASMALTAGATTGPAVVRATTAAVAATNLDFNLTVTPAPVHVSAGNIFFTSDRNATSNPAVDTASVGQPVIWSFSGSHTVHSTGSPSFTSSGTLSTGATYTVTFSAAGTYEYNCAIHGPSMNGRIVVLP